MYISKHNKICVRSFLVFPACLTLLSLVGCNDYPFALAPVSGKVTLDGEPVSNARVVFMPRSSNDSGEAGPYSMGETDSDGRYELATVTRPSKIGAVVSEHRIIISTRRAKIDPNNNMQEIIVTKEKVPRKYHDYTKTPLKFVVSPEGTESANFDL